MKQYILILLLVACNSKPVVIPKAGEVWLIDQPFKSVVKIDSIDQFNCVRFSWEDSTGKHIGVCDQKYFHGEVKPIRDTKWFPPAGRFVDAHFLDSANKAQRGVGIPDDNRVTILLDTELVRRNLNLYTKRQLDSAYRKGKRDEKGAYWKTTPITRWDDNRVAINFTEDGHFWLLNKGTRTDLDSMREQLKAENRRWKVYMDSLRTIYTDTVKSKTDSAL